VIAASNELADSAGALGAHEVRMIPSGVDLPAEVGEEADPPELLHVVCPSRREGFGVACLEAMAHARPVVATSVGGLRDLVVDGETGVVVPPRDVGALRLALERLLADPELRRRLGAAARRRAEERFSWASGTDATLAAYAEAAGTMGP